VRDSAGGWREVDLTLRPGDGGRLEPAAHPRALSLGGQGSTELVRMAYGQAAFSRKWPTPLPAPVVRGNRVTYPQAQAGQDLVITVTRTGFTQRLVAAGGGGAVDEAAGVDGGPGSLVEPATVGLGPLLDTYVQSNVLNVSLGHQPDVRVGTFDGAVVARSFLNWPLEALRGKRVRLAELELWNWHSWSCQPRAWQVWETTVAGAGTAWNRQPEWLAQVAESSRTTGYSAICPDATAGVDLTGLVRKWAGGSGAGMGTVGLRAVDEADVFAWKKWAAAATGEGHPPRLEVTYLEG
ncbi:DNRLRE domain-containing protein, partial [Crossiella equi]